MTKPRRTFPPKVYRAILIRQRNICACGCGEKFETMADVQFDHEKPLHLEGEDVPENLRALKRRHHILKSNREATARAKVKRIQDRDGLLRKKPSRRDVVMAKAMGLEI